VVRDARLCTTIACIFAMKTGSRIRQHSQTFLCALMHLAAQRSAKRHNPPKEWPTRRTVAPAFRTLLPPHSAHPGSAECESEGEAVIFWRREAGVVTARDAEPKISPAPLNRADVAGCLPGSCLHPLHKADETIPGPTKPFSRAAKAARNRDLLASLQVHREGWIMWDVIINLIYHRSCRNYLAGAAAARTVELRIS
jgi:hypothetical protein